MARDGLRPDELARVKNQLKGNMLLGLETSDSRMSRVAKNEIYFQRDFPLAEVAARIDATTNDEIVALAERLVQPGQHGGRAARRPRRTAGRRVDPRRLSGAVTAGPHASSIAVKRVRAGGRSAAVARLPDRAAPPGMDLLADVAEP